MVTRMLLHSHPASLSKPSAFTFSNQFHSPPPSSTSRFKMASAALPPLPDDRVVLGCGAVAVDFLAAVASFPNPDDKIRSTSAKIQGGGNAGNALTCAARLGVKPRLISKVADDPQGKGILEELESDGVDSSFIILRFQFSIDDVLLSDPEHISCLIYLISYLEVSEGGNSPFTYIIVDDQTKTRTCIHTPGYPPLTPDELTKSNLLAALDGARLVYFDSRLHETALIVAQEATRRGIPILIDAERKRDGLDDLLSLSKYAICSAKFPQVIIKLYLDNLKNTKTTLEAWTDAPSIPSALVFMLLKLPNIQFVVVTLGEDGCIMLERSSENCQSEEVDVDDLLETLKHKKDGNATVPTCISSDVVKLHAKGVGTVSGRLLLGTAERIPPSELVDTTGAGDSFIGAVLYALCANMPPEKMLPFAAQVAGIGCRALGARTGLPRHTDRRLSPFLL